MDTLSNPNISPQKYWFLVKRVYRNKKDFGIPDIEDGDKQLFTSIAKASAFTDFFKRQHTLIDPICHTLPDLTLLTDQRLSEVNTSQSEVAKILKSLDFGKAHG